VLRAWGVFDLEGLDAEGEKAREELTTFLQGLDEAASRFEDKRNNHREKLSARGQEFESV
jgi:acyl-[acyl-carrier-protein] desaturase